MTGRFKNLDKAKKNSLWLVIGQVYAMVISFVASPISARFLGTSNLGDLVFGETVISVFQIISQLGLSSIIVIELSKEEERKGEILGTLFVLRLITTCLAVALTLASTLILKSGSMYSFKLVLLQATVIPMQMFEVINYYMQSSYQSVYYAIALMVAATVSSGLKIYFSLSKASIFMFAIVQTIRYGIILLILILAFRTICKNVKLTYNGTYAKELVGRGKHVLLANMGSLVYSHVDKLMIGTMLTSSALGEYNIAIMLLNMWEVVPMAIINGMTPAIARRKKESEESYEASLRKLNLFITALSIAVGIGVFLLGKPFVLLLYGEQFAYSGTILILAIWIAMFAMLGVVRNVWIISEGMERYSKYFIYIGSVVNIILNFILIPRYGAMGAAVATLITEMSVFLVPLFTFKKVRKYLMIILGK